MSLLEVVLVALVGALVATSGTFLGLWLGARRRVRVLRARIAEMEGRRRPRRLVPTPQATVKAVLETATLVRDRGVGGALRTSVEELADWAHVERPDLERMAARDGTVTILFSDIVGSTELNSELGDRAWVRVLARHDRLVRRCVERHDGHVVKTQGDGFMVGFATGPQAVRCAIDVQRGGQRGRARDVEVRIGVHRGDVVHRSGDIFGRNVALAARVAEVADGGEVLVSDAVLETLTPYDDLVTGEPRAADLKGIGARQRLHPVVWQ
ncbi:hypothetical protein GCM10009737_24460 [Nocardioides lentus]|uniref:Guanylate cyclase domain-containing protein n=1 Tax=Nocardioides lentus TaxID=338077 RepID=A0ABN2PHI5_9ACTN